MQKEEMNEYYNLREKDGGGRVQYCLRCHQEFSLDWVLEEGLCNECYNIQQENAHHKENQNLQFAILILTYIIGFSQIIIFFGSLFDLANYIEKNVTNFIKTSNSLLVIILILLIIIYFNRSHK